MGADRLPDPMPECRYCGMDADGLDAMGRPACEEHIEQVADDLGPVSAAVSPAEPPEGVYDEIAAERVRQDAKWGGVPGIDRRDDHTYAAVLGEEFGEVCKAWLERDVAGLREELVQTAAVAVAWIAELDNGGGEPRGR